MLFNFTMFDVLNEFIDVAIICSRKRYGKFTCSYMDILNNYSMFSIFLHLYLLLFIVDIEEIECNIEELGRYRTMYGDIKLLNKNKHSLLLKSPHFYNI